MNCHRKLNIREQAAWMRNDLPSFKADIAGPLLICRGILQPTPLSRDYSVIIQYQLGFRPRVFVPGGQLQRRSAAEPIPHTYADDEPCLYYPKNCEWRAEMKLATSVVSWLALWLMYYEIWNATGEWLGGGIDHKPSERSSE